MPDYIRKKWHEPLIFEFKIYINDDFMYQDSLLLVKENILI